MNPDLHIILLHWNQAAAVTNTLERFSGDRAVSITLWVVDNDSREDQKRLLRACRQPFNLIENPSNLGYAGGINRALEKILAVAGPDAFIALVNNDTEATPDQLFALARAMAECEGAGLIGPVLVEDNKGAPQKSWGGRDISLHPATRIHRAPTPAPANSLLEVTYVPGTVLVMRCAMIRSIGLLDEHFFFSGEIADYAWRARLAGFKCVIDTRMEIVHHADDPSELRSTLYRYYSLRNRFLFIRKHRSHAAVPLMAYWTLIGSVMIIRALIAGRLAEASSTAQALRDGWSGRYGRIKE